MCLNYLTGVSKSWGLTVPLGRFVKPSQRLHKLLCYDSHYICLFFLKRKVVIILKTDTLGRENKAG